LNIISAVAILTLMSGTKFQGFSPNRKKIIPDLPPNATALDQIEWMFRKLDLRFGGPEINKPKKENGQYMLRLILKYLSYRKQSTCEEIAKEEYEKNIQTKRKLKSITDDVRKFIKNNLIWTELVYPDGFKKVYNKQVQAYSLSSVGILYSIYLFSNMRLDKYGDNLSELSIVTSGPTQADIDLLSEEIGKHIDDSVQEPIDLNLIRSLAKEYSHVLPKVFGRFKLFEKMIGKDFELTLIYIFFNLFHRRDSDIPDIDEMLSEYAIQNYWRRELTKNGPWELIAEQISLVFYANLQSDIEDILHSRDFQKWSERNNKKEPTKKEDFRKIQNMAKKIWLEIMDDDKKIKKWYMDFVKEAVESKERELGTLDWYSKEVYSKNF